MRAAYLAWSRGDSTASFSFADVGAATASDSLDRATVSFYYALCLDIRAWCLQKEGRYQEALEQYGQAVRLHLKPPTLTTQYYAHAAGCLYVLGRFDEALLFSHQALAGPVQIPDTSTAEAHRCAALSLAELSRFDEALFHCEAGMVIQPVSSGNIWLMVDRPWLLFLAGQVDKAEASFADLKPVAAVSQHLRQEYNEVLGRVRMSQGRLEEAEALFLESLTDTKGQHPSRLYHLAMLAQSRGDLPMLQKYQDQLQQESPESFYAQRLCEQIPNLSNRV
ncbi:MAG: tetratricopeptide repeat protein [Janthinobacterium lividum]